MGNLATTGTNCFPEAPDITVNNYTISLGGSGAQFHVDPFTPSVSATTLTLSVAPVTGGSFLLFRNGVYQKDTTDYSRSGTTVTLVVAVKANESFVAVYLAAS